MSSLNTQERIALHRNIQVTYRLNMNLFIFCISNLPLLIVILLAFFNIDNLRLVIHFKNILYIKKNYNFRKLGTNEKSECKYFFNGLLLLKIEILTGFVMLTWLIGKLLYV